jgi:hypothetical protein
MASDQAVRWRPVGVQHVHRPELLLSSRTTIAPLFISQKKQWAAPDNLMPPSKKKKEREKEKEEDNQREGRRTSRPQQQQQKESPKANSLVCNNRIALCSFFFC